ncbi:MAG: hypothetical protein KGJ23_13645 [Euryarchaeota archaeon]|nr:hypothetical protein [Euryarchaeota archaeon]MDE1837641.1 hypothetical protein [Euryarchaeota archaeon]MDE2045928.1 hypothetical protein [Thermoplasmata archaeon]
MPSAPPSDDPLKDIADSLRGEAVSWTIGSVKSYAAGLVNRRLAFIGRRDYIAEVRAQKRSAEWKFYEQFVRNKDYGILAQMGLTMRSWQDDPAMEKDIQSLRQRIYKRYGEIGVHIAQVVQSRILSAVIPVAMDSKADPARVAIAIEEFLTKSISLCIFIQEADNDVLRANDVWTRLTKTSPELLVLFARGAARQKGESVAKQVLGRRPDYETKIVEQYGSLMIVFLRKRTGLAS